MTWTAEQDPAAARRAFAVWWWIRRHPDREPAAVVLDLTASNPSVRWRAAQQAAELPTDEVIRALAHASADEKVAWVLETQVRALAAIAGRPLDRKRRSRDDWAALAQELRAQLKASEEGR